MRTLVTLCLFFILVTYSVSAHAEPRVDGTYEINFIPLKEKGTTTGCSLVYHNLLEDKVYEQGRVLALIGNVTFQTFSKNKNAGLSFKIGVAESKNRQRNFLKATNFYLENGEEVINPQTVIDAEMLGFKMLIYDLATSVKVISAVLDNKLSVGFNFEGGTLDLISKIDFTVKSAGIGDQGRSDVIHSNEMLQKFMSCNALVSDNLAKQLEKH